MRISGFAGWRKSSYSGASGGECVEVAQVWHKSTYSNGTGGDCVEIGSGCSAHVPVRDSKDPERGHLLIPTPAWVAFQAAL